MRFLVMLFSLCLLVGGPVALAEVHVDTFYSPTLDRTRSLTVQLPENYDPDLPGGYPVVYFLHGMNGDYQSYWYDSVHTILDDLVHQGLVEPMILVRPDGSTTFLADEGYVDFGGSLWYDSELYGQFETYLVYDVPDYIEATYNAATEPERRAIFGHSMGAFGAMNAALRHHDRYRAVAAHSGPHDLTQLPAWFAYVLAENPDFVYNPGDGMFTQATFMMAGGLSPNLANPPYFVDFPLDGNGDVLPEVYEDRYLPASCTASAANVPLDTNLLIYFDCGTQDDFELYPFNTGLATALDDLGFVADADWFPGDPIEGDYVFWDFPGDHFSHFVIQAHRALRFIDEAFATAPVAVEPTDESATPRPSIALSIQPNPFNPRTRIVFDLNRAQRTRVTIHDLAGRCLHELVAGDLAAGAHELIWQGTDDRGRAMPSGIYLARIETESQTVLGEMTLVR